MNMKLDRNTPPYYFAISPHIETLFESLIKSDSQIILDNKQITVESFLPARARPKDTGYDVRCAEPNGLEISPGCYFKMRLGFRMFAPDGWWLNLAPRSGTFINNHIHPLYGIIDETYENEMCFVGQYIPDDTQLLSNSHKIKIAFGQRIAQVLPSPRWEMPVFRITNDQIDAKYKNRGDIRGTGGFNSSGIA